MIKKYSIAIIFLVSLLISVLIGSHSYALNEPIEVSQLTKQRSGIDSCNRVEIRPTTNNLSYGRGTSWQTCGVRLVFQNDGNLVLFSPRGAVLWATGTERANANELRVQRDGNVVLYANTQPVWQTNTPNNRGAFLALQADGNLVVYASNGRPLFNTNTAGNVARETNAAAQQQQAQQQPQQQQAIQSNAVSCQCVVYVQNYIGYMRIASAKDATSALGLPSLGFRKINAPQQGAIVVMQPGFPGADPTSGHIGFVQSVHSDRTSVTVDVRASNQHGGDPNYTDARCNNVNVHHYGTSVTNRSDISFWVR